MLNIKALSLLAIAGTAAALPNMGDYAGYYFGGQRGNGNDAAATALEIVTKWVTVTADGAAAQPQTSAPAVAVSTQAPVAASSQAPAAPAAKHTHTFAPAPAAPAASSPAAPVVSAAPSAAPSAPAASSGSSGSGYMGIVNEWRGKLGMSTLTESDTLQANALKTVQDGNGQMVHELNPGSFAQVLAPGSADEFEKVFVGGWLCERPDLSGLNGICSTMSQGWAYDGQTGHADILTSTSYSKIGCALANGIWGCDLA